MAYAEGIHIKNHSNALKEEYTPKIEENIEVLDTIQNLKAAIYGEIEEGKTLYPKLIKSIKKECRSLYGKVAKLSMNWAQKVEKQHAILLKTAYKSLKNGKDIEINKIYICHVCGNILLNELSDKECSVCGHDVEFFKDFKRNY